MSASERVLITTLTKRMAEDLTEYLDEHGVQVRYLHSDIDTVERMEIIRDLRLGKFDVLVGINLLREGLDMPEVSLVAILDADKEGFLRSEDSLIQTIGRAARNLNGSAILYADRDDRLDQARDRRDEPPPREADRVQRQHGITPRGIKKGVTDIMEGARSTPRGKKGERTTRPRRRHALRAPVAGADASRAWSSSRSACTSTHAISSSSKQRSCATRSTIFGNRASDFRRAPSKPVEPLRRNRYRGDP